MADVTINYKDAAIATMDASGTKTLQTHGKYCEDDIEVVYVRPSAPSGTKQISIAQNGTTIEDVAAYANAEINVNVSGGVSAQIATGTFTGNDTQYASFSCPFEPDAVYIIRINAVSLSVRVFGGFIGGTFGSHAGNVFFQCNANTTGISIFAGDMGSRKFTYSNNTVTAVSQTTRPVSSACEYAYYAVKWTQ